MKYKDEIEKNKREEFLRLDNDNIIFVPAENLRAIEKVINNWENVKKRFDKIKLGVWSLLII